MKLKINMVLCIFSFCHCKAIIYLERLIIWIYSKSCITWHLVYLASSVNQHAGCHCLFSRWSSHTAVEQAVSPSCRTSLLLPDGQCLWPGSFCCPLTSWPHAAGLALTSLPGTQLIGSMGVGDTFGLWVSPVHTAAKQVAPMARSPLRPAAYSSACCQAVEKEVVNSSWHFWVTNDVS